MDKYNYKLIITKQKQGIYYGYFCEDRPVELYCEPEQDQGRSLLGNIYAARVERVAEGIGGAFLEIDPGQKCYYPLPKNGQKPVKLSPGHEDKLYGGDIILVQITKDAVKSKLPVADGNISLTGKYFVLTLSDHRSGISKKITDPDERKRLSDLVSSFYTGFDIEESGDEEFHQKKSLPGKSVQEKPFGLIVRTNAAGVSENELKKELEQLQSRYGHFMQRAGIAPGKTCIHQEAPHYISCAADLPENELKEIITDDKGIYDALCDHYQHMGDQNIHSKIRLYQEDYPLSKLYRLETHYHRALDKHVWLPSGASLVIEQTEAMVVIDVNTGSVIKKKKNDGDLFYRINCEAADEIGRQLRLRNLSGIIVVDFINMRYENHQKKLLNKLQEICNKDRIRTRVIDITALNLVEITRQKVRKSLSEQCRKISSNGWRVISER